jgi:hypothetical protein
MKPYRLFPLLAVLAACGTFEDPAVVIDLRILAMTAEPPEQVLAFDPADPFAVELSPVEVCALVADPTRNRALNWSMTLCPPQAGGRCADDRPSLLLEEGIVEDPEGEFRTLACATVPAGDEVRAIIQDTIEHDDVSPRFSGEAEAVYGVKSVRYSPLQPAERVANTNPHIERYAVSEQGIEVDQLHPRRCTRDTFPFTVGPGDRVIVVPIEPDGIREEYVVPTFEGGSRRFTEYMTYQWLAAGGTWSRFDSGGPRDPSGNRPAMGSTWTAPDVDQLVEIPVWIVQRDERGGGSWFESCIRVDPDHVEN